MRLLLDELYSHEIAQQLRARGHDVIAVAERSDLRGLADERLFNCAAADRRALVTENWRHFSALLTQAAHEGANHYGVVFTSGRQMPRGRGTIGLFVGIFDEFLGAQPSEDALANGVRWLP